MNGGKPVQVRLIMAIEKPEAPHKVVYFFAPRLSVSQLSRRNAAPFKNGANAF